MMKNVRYWQKAYFGALGGNPFSACKTKSTKKATTKPKKASTGAKKKPTGAKKKQKTVIGEVLSLFD